MDCEKCVNELTAYLDGELSEPRAREIGLHTQVCRSCSAELQAMKESAAFLDSRVRTVEPRPEMWQNVRARISVLEAPAPSDGLTGFIEMHRWATVAAGLIAAVALAAGAWEFISYEQSQKQLRQYMNAYVQERESRDAGASPGKFSPSTGAVPRSPISPVAFSGDDSNPFLKVDSIPDGNPFRAEAQR
jgi:anti-sigma factor RsiW